MQKLSSIRIITILPIVLFLGNANVFAEETNTSLIKNDILLEEQTEIITEKIINLRGNLKKTVEQVNVSSFEQKERLVAPLEEKQLSTTTHENVFVGFSDCEQCYAVNVLKERKIIEGYANKFYPQNDVRQYMMTKMLVDAYRSKMDISLDSELGLTYNSYFNKSQFNEKINKYFDTAYELGLREKEISEIDFEAFVSKKEFKIVLEKFATQFPEIVNKNTLESVPSTDEILNKYEMAEYLVQFFDLSPISAQGEKRYFFDTAYHEYGEAVESLAKLHIVNHEKPYFDINQNTSRADFAVMLARSLSYFNNFDLNLVNTDANSIIDVDGAPYEAEVLYLNQLGLIDYLLEIKREQTLFNPQQALTLHEAYHIIEKASGEYFEYDTHNADQKLITRGELAKLLTTVFDYEKPSQYKYSTPQTTTTQSTNSLDETISLLSKLKSLF